MQRILLGGLALAAACGPAAAGDEIAQGLFRGQAVTYHRVGGRAVFQGDILLDHVAPLPAGRTAARTRPGGMGLDYPGDLWPKAGGVAQIPYIVTTGSANLTTALAQFNATFKGVIQLVARQAQADYVDFALDPNDASGVCESYVGRAGGAQVATGSIDCSVGTLLHEMGHILGLYHEQSRPDRDRYVTVEYGNIIKGSRDNFDILTSNAQVLGPYDYGSVMQYVPFAFTRNGGTTIESIPAGMPLSNATGYTAADIDAVKRLYGHVPSAVTVATNPPGLAVIVDGHRYATPHSFAWALGSSHGLKVPGGLQTLDGTSYLYGRWNDGGSAGHTITVAPGPGTLAQPADRPAVTVYTASFIQLSSYAAAVWPAGAGTVSASPAARSFAGTTGQFYVARQKVTLTATANAGYGFLEWSNTSAPWSANPKLELAPGQITAYFSSQPITTVTTSPPGFGVLVDGGWWQGPQNFASDLFPSWTQGSSHTLAVPTPQLPYSINSRAVFEAWSDGGAASHSIIVPAGASTLTASLAEQFVPIAYATPSCAASVAITPASADGFYAKGTKLQLRATPAAGWVLTGWQDDLSGGGASKALTVNDEELAVAGYDTTATPLAVVGLSPPGAAAGTGATTLAIDGAGFTASSIVFVNNLYRASSYVGPGEITVALGAADLARPGAFPVGVSNFPAGAPCSAYQAQDFTVSNPGPPLRSPRRPGSSR